MKSVTITRRFDAAFTRMLGSGAVYEESFQMLVEAFREHDLLPPEWNEHRLTREWTGYWEAHLDNDVIVVYKRTGHEIRLVDVGQHEDMFPNYRRWAVRQGRPPGQTRRERNQSVRRARRAKEKGKSTRGQWPGLH